jgi:hypothetical protein
MSFYPCYLAARDGTWRRPSEGKIGFYVRMTMGVLRIPNDKRLVGIIVDDSPKPKEPTMEELGYKRVLVDGRPRWRKTYSRPLPLGWTLETTDVVSDGLAKLLSKPLLNHEDNRKSFQS